MSKLIDRPNIPKLKIKRIGGFELKRVSVGGDTDSFIEFPDDQWIFDGEDVPDSVGLHYSEGWALYGGFTVEELREIRKSASGL